MKKILLLILGITILGGTAYAISSSGVLQGSFMMPTSSTKTISVADQSLTTQNALQTAQNSLSTKQKSLDNAVAGTNTATLDATKNTNTATSSTYSCSSLTIDPGTVTVASDEEAAAGIDFTVNISLAQSAAYISHNLEAFTLPTGATWEGTLMIKTSGTGTFTDSKGKTGTSLSIPATQSRTSFKINYSGGASGDILSAYIENEQGCSDTLTIELSQTSTTQTTTASSTFTCSGLNVTPDSYTLTSSESSMDFTVTVKGSTQTAWAEIVKNFMAFTIMPGTTTTSSGTLANLIVETDGSGSLSNNKNSETGTQITVPLKATSSTIKVNYKTPVAGDTLTAYVDGQENKCTDTLTLSAAAATTTESTTAQPTTTTTTPATTQTTTSTATTTTSDALDSNADTIIGSSDYSCSDPFNDVGSTEWYSDLVCRMYQANLIDGRSQTNFVPSGYMTYAEAIKVLDLIAGYTANDASGKTEDFLDVSEGDWYYPYVVIAETKDVIRTRDAGPYFNPNNPIPRAWFVLYAARMADKTLSDWSESDIPFSDLKKDSPYTYAIILAYNTTVTTPEDGNTRIVTGYSDGTFHPDVFIKRSEAMAIAQRIYLSWFSNQ